MLWDKQGSHVTGRAGRGQLRTGRPRQPRVQGVGRRREPQRALGRRGAGPEAPSGKERGVSEETGRKGCGGGGGGVALPRKPSALRPFAMAP